MDGKWWDGGRGVSTELWLLAGKYIDLVLEWKLLAMETFYVKWSFTSMYVHRSGLQFSFFFFGLLRLVVVMWWWLERISFLYTDLVIVV